MKTDTWPFVPPTHRHTFGESPFRVRGSVFTGFLDYTQRHVPGGLSTICADIGTPHVVQFLRETIFLAASSYDIEPLMLLLRALSQRNRIPVDRLVLSGSRGAAEQDVAGKYRAQLRSTSAEEMAPRLPRIFMRYFDPCTSEIASSHNQMTEIRFGRLPPSALGFYVWAAEGFMIGAMEAAGAKDVRFIWGHPSPDGELENIPVQNISARITWTND